MARPRSVYQCNSTSVRTAPQFIGFIQYLLGLDQCTSVTVPVSALQFILFIQQYLWPHCIRQSPRTWMPRIRSHQTNSRFEQGCTSSIYLCFDLSNSTEGMNAAKEGKYLGKIVVCGFALALALYFCPVIFAL